MPPVDSFRLFLRMLDLPGDRGRLYGDLSAMAQFNRCEELRTLLARPSSTGGFVDGTDSPLPAISACPDVQARVRPATSRTASELESHDVLDCDFTAKSTVRATGGDAEKRFPPRVFMILPELLPRLAPA